MVDEVISNQQKGWETTDDVIHHFPLYPPKREDNLLDTKKRRSCYDILDNLPQKAEKLESQERNTKGTRDASKNWKTL